MPIKVKAQAKNKAEVLIYEAIGENWYGDGLTAKRIDEELKALGDVKEIKVRINSPGGAVFDGIAIYNILKNHAATVHVVVDGLAASAASIIAMAGDKVSMGQATQIMIHNPWTIAWGDSDEMKKVATMLDSIRDGMVDAYMKRTGLMREEIVSMLDAETWMSPAVAIEKGFADELLDRDGGAPDEDDQAAAASSPRWAAVMSSFRNVPNSLKPQPRAGIQLSAQAVATPEEKTMPKEASASVTQTDIDIETAKGEAKADATRAEKKRRAEVKSVFSGRFATDHSQLLAECLDEMECSADTASKRLLAKLGEDSEPLRPANITNVVDARDKFLAGATQAILARAGLEKREQGNDFYGMSLADLAGHALAQKNISVRGMTKDGIARKVLASHSTSDFPYLLSNTAGKILRKAYELQPVTWNLWCKTGSVSDFKANTRHTLGSFSSLVTKKEGGEYKQGSLGEEKESITAGTKGRFIQLTREMIVNDDLSGFADLAAKMGRAAARTIESDVYTSLISASGAGPTMNDTGALFNATAVTTAGGHANLTSSGTAISVASIAVGEAAMMAQKDKSLNDYVMARPRFLLCAPGKKQIAWNVVNSVTDVSSSNANSKNYVKEQLNLEVLSSPYLSGNRWYLLADPNNMELYEVAFLDGVQEPFIDDEVEFMTDAMNMKVRLDYGIAAIDFRAGYNNAGA